MAHPELILIMSAIEALTEFVPKPVGLVATTIRDAEISQTVSIFFSIFWPTVPHKIKSQYKETETEGESAHSVDTIKPN